MHKCLLGATEINFLGQTITDQGKKPQKQNVQHQTPEVEKCFTALFVFPELLSKLCPKTVRTPSLFYRMLKSDEKILGSKQLIQQFEKLTKPFTNIANSPPTASS